MGFLILLILYGLLMLAIYTAFKKWQARRKVLKELNVFLRYNERKRKVAVKEMERLDRAFKAQIYNLKVE